MSRPPQSDWDRLLQSSFRLKAGAGLRFDTTNGYCLFDQSTGRSFSLDPWQRSLLRGVEGGEIWTEVIGRVLRQHGDETDRGQILKMIRGLVHHRFLIADRAEKLDFKKETASRKERRRLSQPKGQRWLLESAICAVVAAAAVSWNSFRLSDPAGAKTDESSLSALEWSSDASVPVRVWCRGVVTQVLVRDGDRVRAGDVLARIVDPMARATRDDLRSQLGECRMRRDRFYKAGNLVAYLKESQALAKLAGLVSEWEVESGPVVLRAPIDGLVKQRLQPDSVGGQVSPGDVLMTIETDSIAAADRDHPLIAGEL
ncbi:MAG: biotin/lipoyl-binding protein [Verrucomicrobiae bacterium]|nr:biotin/lipoyl-binding protein [Verrucomicrobiae bacterium]MCB1090177.1 biotin/lipoyl-binding protein [Verrucomicrobiae bacterium]